MNTANLENSKRLYGLSGWDTSKPWNVVRGTRPGLYVPSYDAGYIWDRLEYAIGLSQLLRLLVDTVELGDRLADALCLIAIQLFEAGVFEE